MDTTPSNSPKWLPAKGVLYLVGTLAAGLGIGGWWKYNQPEETFKVLFNTHRSSIVLQDFTYKPNIMEKNVSGIQVSCELVMPNADSLQKKFIMYQMRYRLKSGTRFLTPIVAEERYTKYFSNGKRCEFFIPYTYFHELPTGLQNIELEWEGMYKMASDSLQRLSPQSIDTHAGIAFPLEIPPIQKIQWLMANMETDTTRYQAATMDVAMFGPGYPDLYWTLQYGDEMVYTSPVCTNALRFCRKDTVPDFFVSALDSLSLSVYDFDAVSQHDGMGNIHLSGREVLGEKCSFSFGNIKEMTFVSKKITAAMPPKPSTASPSKKQKSKRKN